MMYDPVLYSTLLYSFNSVTHNTLTCCVYCCSHNDVRTICFWESWPLVQRLFKERSSPGLQRAPTTSKTYWPLNRSRHIVTWCVWGNTSLLNLTFIFCDFALILEGKELHSNETNTVYIYFNKCLFYYYFKHNKYTLHSTEGKVTTQ